MSRALSFLIGITCIAVIAASSLYLYGEWQEYTAKKQVEAATKAKFEQAVEAAKIAALKAAQERADKRLSPITCNGLAHLTMPSEKGGPVKTTAYNTDLKTCAELDRLGSYERESLTQAGIF